jgi:lysozyme
MALTTKQKLAGVSTAAVIAATVPVLTTWEGTDYVAKPDMIGTGHPITYCHGQTDEFGRVKAGTRFTKDQCDKMLAESLPPYLERLQGYVHVELPVKTWASLLDASYNAGTAAVGRSPMVRKMNAGDIRGGCEAFKGWYISSDHVIRKGLVARRSGLPNDPRVNERQLCLEGLNAPKKAVAKPAVTAAIAVIAKNPPKKTFWARVRGWIFK